MQQNINLALFLPLRGLKISQALFIVIVDTVTAELHQSHPFITLAIDSFLPTIFTKAYFLP